MPDAPSQPRRSGRIPATDLADHDASLVEAAGRLFRRHGFSGVSIDMIAREASVSPKTIYARHGGKSGLFAAVIDELVRRPLDVWDSLDPEADPRLVLTAAADRFLAIVLTPDVIALERAIIAEAERFPILAQTFYTRGPRRGLDRLADYFSEQHRRRSLQIDDPGAAAHIFISVIEGELVRRALFVGEPPKPAQRRRWLEYAVARFVRAFTGESGRNGPALP